MNDGTTQQDPRGADKAPNLVDTPDLTAQHVGSIEGGTAVRLDKEREPSATGSNALHTRQNATRGDESKEKTKDRDQAKSTADDERQRHLQQTSQTILDITEVFGEMVEGDMDSQKWSLMKASMRMMKEYIHSTLYEIETLRETKGSGVGTVTSNSPRQLPQTWAQKIAAQTTRRPPDLPISSPPSQALLGGAKEKKVAIHIGDLKLREELKDATPAQLQDMFQRTEGVSSGSIIAARRTQNGCILLQMASIEAKKVLEKREEAVKRVCTSARIIKTPYIVAVDSVRIEAFNDKDQGACIEKLKRENRALHPDMGVTKVEWPGFAFALNESGIRKKYSTLLVETETPEAANRLIAEGIVESSQLLNCRRWEIIGLPKQCHNCQKYGHEAKGCKNATKCGHCGGLHLSKEHGDRSERGLGCAVCGGKHEAWSKSCSDRQREIKRMKQRLAGAPKWFRESPVIPSASGQPIRDLSPQQTDERWEIVGPRKRKQLGDITDRTANGTNTPTKLGRPRILSRKEPGQKPLYLNQSQKIVQDENIGTSTHSQQPDKESDTPIPQ